ncbi:MAG: hypothetical protein R3E68_22715 [Burkholderiaceae bacterium]
MLMSSPWPLAGLRVGRLAAALLHVLERARRAREHRVVIADDLGFAKGHRAGAMHAHAARADPAGPRRLQESGLHLDRDQAARVVIVVAGIGPRRHRHADIRHRHHDTAVRHLK